MTKQEEIQGWVTNYLVGCIHGAAVSYGDLSGYNKSTVDFQAEELLKELSSQGVVIKVDRELPNIYSLRGFGRFAEEVAKAGYVAIEPLIKE